MSGGTEKAEAAPARKSQRIRNLRFRRFLVGALLFAWFGASWVIGIKLGFVESRIQVLEDSGANPRIGCHAVWIGPMLDALGFHCNWVSKEAGGEEFSVVVDPDSMECREGRCFEPRTGPNLGVLSLSLVKEKVGRALPELSDEQAGLVAQDVITILTETKSRGMAAMTFKSYEDGGGIAEGRLHYLNSYGEPGEAVSFRFKRIAVAWLMLGALGCGAAKLAYRRLGRTTEAIPATA